MKIKILLLLALVSLQAYAQNSPYVLMVSFDGFRWDYANRGLTPNLDSIKNAGVSALSLEPAFPSKTYPNHYSIMTGMYPEHHGIIANSFIDTETNEKYKLGDTISVREGKWYTGEAFWETARKKGITSASFYWPGSEVNNENRRPHYFKYYDHHFPYSQRLEQVVSWLKLPYNERPHFICFYFDATDGAGHKYGTNSAEVNEVISSLDSLIGKLNFMLNETEVKDSINLIVVSDHGMTDVSSERIINIEEMLLDYTCTFSEAGPVVMIFPERSEDITNIYNFLKSKEDHFRVYLKDNIPEYYHFSDNKNIAPVILIADLGWTLRSNSNSDWMYKDTFKGNHGYKNFETDMHGIFFAAGPKFKKGLSTGTIKNIDIYPLLCRLFEINIPQNIDGKSERIEFILAD